MATYDEIRQQNSDLIRKALGGSLFLAPYTASAITTLTTHTPAVTGPPAVPEKIELTTLPEGYEDAGFLTDDGLSFANEVSTSDTTSWQSQQPTRSDITSDSDTITAAMQETKLLTIGVYTGALISANQLAANTRELSIAKPLRPSTRYYRALALAVDGEGDDEFFIGRFYPKLRVTAKSDQAFAKTDDGILWGVTFTSHEDATLGYSMKWLFGGKGWKDKAAAMGFAVA